MTDAVERLLGAAIRRRRTTAGLQQREVAEAIGLATVVYGRIELGSRPVRATELRDIAKVLGTTADSLLEEVVPVPPEEYVERAVTMRDASYGALAEYARALLAAIPVVGRAKDGVRRTTNNVQILGREDRLRTTDDLMDYLAAPQPPYQGLTVTENQAALLRRAWDVLLATIPIHITGEDDDD